MVATIGALCERCPSEFSGPYHERILQQSPQLEVFQQSGDGLVHRMGVGFVTGLQVTMLIPPVGAVGLRTGKFYEPHAALHQSPRHQALRAIVARVGIGGVQPI